jgi:hypothetical protein
MEGIAMRTTAAAIGALMICGACGGSSSMTTTPTAPLTSITIPSGAPGTGTITLLLKDSPFSDAKALLVSFSEVNVHADGGDWFTVPFAGGATGRTCDLKKLETAQDILGVASLPAGHYTQLRLVVSSATIYFENASSGLACDATLTTPLGTKASVTIPSGELKLNRQFDLAEGGGLSILLDFDGDKSVKLTGSGKYMMTPVIGVISVQ